MIERGGALYTFINCVLFCIVYLPDRSEPLWRSEAEPATAATEVRFWPPDERPFLSGLVIAQDESAWTSVSFRRGLERSLVVAVDREARAATATA